MQTFDLVGFHLSYSNYSVYLRTLPIVLACLTIQRVYMWLSRS